MPLTAPSVLIPPRRRGSARWAVGATDFTGPAMLQELVGWWRSDAIEAQTVFTDAFDDASLDSAWTQVSGTWTEASGVVSTGSGVLANTGLGIANGVFTGRFRMNDNNASGVVFSYIDANTFLLLNITAGSNVLQLYKNVSGFTELASATPTVSASTYYTVKVVKLNDLIRVYLDGVHQLDHTLSSGDFTTFDSGTGAGFRANSSSDFDSFTVTTVDYDTDLTLATDSFTRADSTALGNEEGVNALAWTEDSGDFQITSNQLVRVSGTAIATVNVAEQNVDVSATLLAASSYLCIHYADNDNYVIVGRDGAGYSIYKRIAAVFTSLYNSAQTLNGTEVFRAIATADGRIFLVVDGSYVTSVDVSADMGSLGSKVGIYGAGVGSGADNFTVLPAPKVPVWFDKSTGANHATQTDPDLQPLLLPDQTDGGGAAVVFDGSDDYLIATDLATTQPATVAASVNAAIADTEDIISRSTGGVGEMALLNTGKAYLYTGSGNVQTANTTSANTQARICALWTSTSKVQLDGGAVASGATGTNPLAGTPHIGRRGDTGTNHMDGHIAELIVWDTDHDMWFDELDTYLTSEWE